MGIKFQKENKYLTNITFFLGTNISITVINTMTSYISFTYNDTSKLYIN